MPASSKPTWHPWLSRWTHRCLNDSHERFAPGDAMSENSASGLGRCLQASVFGTERTLSVHGHRSCKPSVCWSLAVFIRSRRNDNHVMGLHMPGIDQSTFEKSWKGLVHHHIRQHHMLYDTACCNAKAYAMNYCMYDRTALSHHYHERTHGCLLARRSPRVSRQLNLYQLDSL